MVSRFKLQVKVAYKVLRLFVDLINDFLEILFFDKADRNTQTNKDFVAFTQEISSDLRWVIALFNHLLKVMSIPFDFLRVVQN